MPNLPLIRTSQNVFESQQLETSHLKNRFHFYLMMRVVHFFNTKVKTLSYSLLYPPSYFILQDKSP